MNMDTVKVVGKWVFIVLVSIPPAVGIYAHFRYPPKYTADGRPAVLVSICHDSAFVTTTALGQGTEIERVKLCRDTLMFYQGFKDERK